MDWLQILAQAGIIGTFFGAGIAVAAYFNGKHIKTGVSKIDQSIAKLGDTLAQMEKNAEQRHREVIELFNKMTELLKKGFGDLSRDIRESKAG